MVSARRRASDDLGAEHVGKRECAEDPADDPDTDIADPLRTALLKAGDHILMDSKSGYLLEKLPKSEVEDLALEEVPDIGYDDIGGLTTQIDAIKDAVELPYLYADYYKEHQLTPPKGVLLYGPPGCGQGKSGRRRAGRGVLR